jgi:ribosome biogenesis GTPase / thiamine phosphate phosphatase
VEGLKMDLSDFGWNSFMEKHFEEYKNDLIPARVIRDSRGLYSVICIHGELTARVSGNFINSATSKSAYPVVGDWVALKALPDEEAGVISAVLPRKTGFSRKAASEVTEEQVVAANIDTVFLVNGLDDNFNLRRIERYLTLVWDSGANPVVILNKSDLCDDVDDYIGQVEEIAIGAMVISTSAAGGINIDLLRKYTGKGKTVAFLGSSGVGKSSLINRLLGEDRLKVNEVREGDSKGRHTTTHRELILLPDGGALIDTPGMRELQLWIDAESLSKTFEDV